MIYINSKIQIYYLFITRFISNYKGEIVINSIKSSIYYLICIVLAIKYEKLCKNWPL